MKKVYSGTSTATPSSSNLIKSYDYVYSSTSLTGVTDWKDLLTEYDGEAITYDEIGNPTEYRGKAMTWNGRNLTMWLDNDAGTAAIYAYDASGMRTSKLHYGELYNYYYVEGKLMGESTTQYDLFYTYDANGFLNGIKKVSKNGTITTYGVLCNMFGDVIAIYSSSGSLLAKYTYDSWGKLISITDANENDITNTVGIWTENSIRYRGYVYDNETGWYYLQSRYYDPDTCRFINADGLIAANNDFTINLYAYCGCNPISREDVNGYCWEDANGVVRHDNWENIRTTPSTSIIAATNSSNNPYRRPNTGDPGSTYKTPNGDTRTYGPDGKPVHDYDHDDHGKPNTHPHDENGGHHHDWDWSKNPPRQPPYVFDWEPVMGVALVAVCAVGIIVIAADNFTGVGVADDFLFAPLGSGVGQGLVLIFG